MRPIVKALLAEWVGWYDPPPGPVVELGSVQVEDGDDLRPIFGDRPYIGVDLAVGRGVDVQADGMGMLPLRTNSAGIVVCADTLEHVTEPWRLMPEAYRILQPGGYLLVITVFWFPIHYEPDYWRFTPAALEHLMKRAGATSIQSWYHGPNQIPQTVAVVARKDAAIPEVQLRVPAEIET